MKRRMNFLLAALLSLVACSLCSVDAGATGPDDIVGRWKTFKDGRHHGTVEVYRTDRGSYEGRIVWGEHPDRLDAKNPEPALRTRKLIGTVILRDFRYKGENDWSGGRIYDPDSGNEYKSYMKLESDGRDRNTLRLRGYVGISLLGRTEKWMRDSAGAGN